MISRIGCMISRIDCMISKIGCMMCRIGCMMCREGVGAEYFDILPIRHEVHVPRRY
jgi:hypothetical protein